MQQNRRGKIALYYAIDCDGSLSNGNEQQQNQPDAFEFLLRRSHVSRYDILSVLALAGLSKEITWFYIIPFLGEPLLLQDKDNNWSMLHSLTMRS